MKSVRVRSHHVIKFHTRCHLPPNPMQNHRLCAKRIRFRWKKNMFPVMSSASRCSNVGVTSSRHSSAAQSAERITRDSKFAMINRPSLLARIGTLLAQSVERAACAWVQPITVNKVRLDGRANFDSMVQSCLWHRSQFTRPLFIMILVRTTNMQRARLMHGGWRSPSVQVRTRFYCLSIYTFIHFDVESVNEVGDA